MGDGFAKLFADIVDSSIWQEDGDTCKVWVTLLALADAEGFVRGSIGWLASKSKVSVACCQRAVNNFLSPDAASRTPAHEGRRIKEVERGWLILNYLYFRNEHKQLSNNPRRVYQREWMRKKRESTGCQHESTSVNPASASASESSEGDARGNQIPVPSAALPRAGAGISEGKGSDRLPTTPQSKRVAAIFHRKPTTGWQTNEIDAYHKLGTIPEDDLAALEKYYSDNWPPTRGVNILRTDLLTLLNNFQGEVGRAHAAQQKPRQNTPAAFSQPMSPAPEPPPHCR